MSKIFNAGVACAVVACLSAPSSVAAGSSFNRDFLNDKPINVVKALASKEFTSTEDADGSALLEYADGTNGMLTNEGVMTLNFPGSKGFSMVSYPNGTKFFFRASGNYAHEESPDGAVEKYDSIPEKMKEWVAKVPRRNLGEVSSDEGWLGLFSGGIKICGNYAGPGWCSDKYVWECYGCSDLGSSDSYPQCKTPDQVCSRTSGPETNNGVGSCIDQCAKDHDGCCAGNRVNCNKEFSACLNSCDYWPASSFVIGSSDYYTGMCTKGLYRMSATEIWAGMDLLAGDCCGTSC